MEMRAVSAAVVDPRGRILLVRRTKPPFAGRLSLPGGRVELGEDLESAARREILEETGIRASTLVVLGERTVTGRELAYVIAVFAARSEDPDAIPCAGDDADFAAWFDQDELDRSDLEEGQRAFAAAAIRVFA